jgi:hypothetical protein
MRFRISFGWTMSFLGPLTGMPRSQSYVELDDTSLRVRMGIGFSARIDRAAVRAARRYERGVVSMGVHGWGGSWLVNGARTGIVDLDISPPARARVMGFPVSLRRLDVSLEDPDGFLAALDA